jgi:glycosyltransferase involved in cell wall biosynthesis
MTTDVDGASTSHVPTEPPNVSVVVPCYRSAATLGTLCDAVAAVLGPIVDEFEIVLVDDGSRDDTWQTIRELADRHAFVHGLTMLRNFGQHNALLAGLRMARHPVIVTMDDDLQHPPDQIPRLLERLDDETDLVYGSPSVERQTHSRNLASRASKRLMRLALGNEVHPRASAFRAFRRDLVEASRFVADPAISIDVLLGWGTSRITAIDIEQQPRQHGASGYSWRSLTKHALTMITGYSIRPLRFAGLLGLLIATLGFGLLTYVLVTYALGATDVAGFTFLAAAITLFSGVQLLSLGVIGEYLGRVHFRTLGKPVYVVRATTTPPGEREAAWLAVEPSQPKHVDAIEHPRSDGG